MQIRIVHVVITAILGVAASPAGADWKATRVTTDTSAAADCRFIQTIHGKYTKLGASSEKLFDVMRKQAFDLGGNLIVLHGSATAVATPDPVMEGRLMYIADGDAYACMPAGAIPADPLAKELLALEDKLFRAQLDKDMTVLTSLISDEAVIIEDGKQKTKAEFLADVMNLPDIPVGIRMESEHGNVTTRMDADIAEIAFISTMVLKSKQRRRPFAVVSVRDRYKRSGDSWTLVSGESKTISQAVK